MPDNTENKRKTLANCKNSEFLPAAMKSRALVYEYYKKINIEEIMERFRSKYEQNNDEDDKKKAAAENTKAIFGLISDVIGAIFTEYPTETVQIAAIAGFMSEEEAESIDPSEIYMILLECALSVRVLDFFINAARMDGRDTDGIFRALIFLRLIGGEMNTSGKESQNSTTDTSASAAAGDMSENA
jgi:hypothetical protein